ncbi:MAG: hypothetical protein WCT19_02035 [Candidatus Paceibacterota bacterium]|jgi:hypothetical protein
MTQKTARVWFGYIHMVVEKPGLLQTLGTRPFHRHKEKERLQPTNERQFVFSGMVAESSRSQAR